jgi:Flp pilus assembly protein TadD
MTTVTAPDVPQPVAAPMAVASAPEAQTGTAAAAAPVFSLRLDEQLERAPAPTPAPPAASTAVATVRAKPTPLPEPVREAAPHGRLSAPAVLVPVPPAAAVAAEKTTASVPSQAAVPASAAASPASDAAQQAQRQGAAARDALAQAQSLWSSGNPAAAIDLLREAVQVAQRTTPASPAADSTLVAMVRELARMQMGSGRVGEAYEVLVQHEARLKGHAELWAMRANAAQRLGQHQDSVQAYMQALQFRPQEQRWLLGLAVSLAAMGQSAAASDVVERARAQGPIPRDIADYLRPLGVTVK